MNPTSDLALRTEALITAKHYGIQSSAVHFSSKLEWMSHRGVLMLRQVSLHRNPISVTLYVDAMRSCFGESKLQSRALFVLAECAATLASLTIVEPERELEPEVIEPEVVDLEPEPKAVTPKAVTPKAVVAKLEEPKPEPKAEVVKVEEPKPETKIEDIVQAMSVALVKTKALPFSPPTPVPAPIDVAKLGSVISSELSACMMKMMEMQAKMTREIIAEMHDADRSNISMIVDAITAPKRIVRDEDGHPVGVEVGAA